MTIGKTMHMQSIKRERTDPAIVTAFGSAAVSSAASGNLESVQNLSQNGNDSVHPVVNEMAQRNVNPHGNVTNQQAGSHGIMNQSNPSFSKPVEIIENLENLVDFPSIKGLFGWTTVDDVNVPYILRHDKRFVSVRIVELKLLSRYPNAYPDELGRHKPLTSFFITHNEAKLLNEINLVHCGGEYGRKEFSQKDLIVLLSDFVEFYNLVKKTFPESTNTKNTKASEEKELSSYCGWLQINNTVTPYVKRPSGKYVPLSVIRYAAGLMTSENDSVKGVLPTQIECDLMNRACKLAGFNFNFAKTTRIIALTDILQTNFVHVTELPMENPLSHAHYMEFAANKFLLSGHCEPNRQNPAYPNLQSSQNSLMQLPHRNVPPDKSQQGNMLNNMGNIPSHLMRPPPPYPGIFNPRLPFMTPFNGFQNFPGMPQPNPMGDFPPVPPNASLRPHLSSGPGPPPTSGAQRPMLLPYILPQAQTQFQGGGSHNRPLPSPHSSRPGSAADLNKRSPGHASGPSPSQESRPSSGHQSSLVLQSKSPYGPQEIMFPASGNVLTNPTMQRNMISGQQMFPLFPVPTSTQQNSGQNIRSPTNMNPGMLVGIQAMQQQVNSLQQINNIRTAIVTRESDIPLTTKTQEKVLRPTSSLTNVASAIPGLYSPPKQQPSQQKNSNSIAGIGGPPPLLMMAPSNVSVSSSATIVSSADASKSIEHGKQETTIIDLANTSSPKSSQEFDTKEKPLQIGSDFIKGAWLNGKSISCLHIETPERKGRYCLVEAVCKLYFNGGGVNEFLFALENVLNVPLLTCTDEEEKAFIQYYNLPVTVLKCNKMISFDDLKNYFPQLSYMFPEKQQTLNCDITNGSQSNSCDLSQTIEENNNIPASEMTGLIAIPLGSLSDMPSVNRHSALSSTGGEKRHCSSHDEGPVVKHAKFLESAIQKFRNQQQQLQGDKTDDTGSNQQRQRIAEDAVIVLD
ncbi:hypothetical protein CHS0354_029252 [Potamilus streckersoni]|uniref:Uncharacterized protein n=1 Tax=Potamilus streckersoni TaxID=2493646 RepID=A0AAE0SZH9_9BIVA|nr:hypothetical protein CHS0354_029252 [Potamilus streckersoni]